MTKLKRSEAWLIFCCILWLVIGFVFFVTALHCDEGLHEQKCAKNTSTILYSIGGVMLGVPTALFVFSGLYTFCYFAWHKLIKYMF